MLVGIYHNKNGRVPLIGIIPLLMTHCYCILAILEKKVYIDEELVRNYRVEDFLWSGSGDDSDENEATSPIIETSTVTSHYTTVTVFHTTTIMSTATIIYNTVISSSSILSEGTKCENIDGCTIEPTAVVAEIETTSVATTTTTVRPPKKTDSSDKRYWIITELKNNGSINNMVSIPYKLEQHLAKLYRIAFNRQQAVHLGLNSNFGNNSEENSGRWKRANQEDRVTVQIHNVYNTTENLKILYSVRVAGQPILANTAVRDMTYYVSDSEVVAELGFPVITKAKTYLNADKEPDLASSIIGRHQLFIIFGIAFTIIVTAVLIMIVFVFFAKSKKWVQEHSQNNENVTSYVIRREENGTQPDTSSPKIIMTANKATDDADRVTNNSLEIEEHETEPSTLQLRADKFLRPQLFTASSPNSFLSMPSVKDFPSASLPQPLIDVLTSPDNLRNNEVKLIRRNSTSAEDPGVIRPVIWNPDHQPKKKFHDVEHINEFSMVDSGTMTEKNFQIQDISCSSSSGSEVESPSKQSKIIYRTQSAPYRSPGESPWSFGSQFHLKTSLCYVTKDKESAIKNLPKAPRDVWGGNISSRTSSTTNFTMSEQFRIPTINPEVILTDAHLSPDDPAIPVITAIREELEKFPSRKSSPQ